MIIDLAAQTVFGDDQGMKNFFLVHRFVHEATASALTTKFGVSASSFGISDSGAMDAWLEQMRNREAKQPLPATLAGWLKLHADIHIATYSLLGQNPTTAPDLSIVDFGNETEFYDWMFVHQSMHDFEQASLGLS